MLHAHLLFVTKRRSKVFSAVLLRCLDENFTLSVRFEEFNGEPEHVRLLVTYSPTIFRVSEQP